MYDLADNLQETLLIRIRSDLTSEKPRLTSAPDVRRSETIGGSAKHGQIRFLIPDGDRLGIVCEGPVAKRSKTRSFVDLLACNHSVDRCVTESESIELEIHEKLVHNVS
jgi:hypothetical protein